MLTNSQPIIYILFNFHYYRFRSSIQMEAIN